jgi:malto-oligosyltrehalose synthase
MYNPVSTYRIQFHQGFTFADFERILPYLVKLGIKTIYASPIFEAVPGSTHGYDGLNPLKINPEIGTIQQLRKISKKLKKQGIGWIQDIVPNHMAFHPDNPWLMDVLEKGPNSAYKNYFDQSLSDRLFKGPIMVPFLGDDLDTVIARGELTIQRTGKKLFFDYAGNKWPLREDTYPNDLELSTGELKRIADQQYYRLCSWQETDERINYRRFFTVNGLICLNMQRDKVFIHFHQLINELVKEEIFDGLRIDHIDGLFDPGAYLKRLRKLCGSETYIVVEKILESEELMPLWPIQGNTGYDFLAIVNNLLTNQKSRSAFTSFYRELSENELSVDEQIRRKKALILKNHMAGELENLAGLLRSGLEVEITGLKEILTELLIRFPVYRFYGNRFPLDKNDHNLLTQIFEEISATRPEWNPGIHTIQKWLDQHSRKALHFYQRCMQFTGPLTAKGVEDTLMYTYNRFIAHNEVGDAPAAFGIAVLDFHNHMRLRQKTWPLSLNGTSTHDTKRGEDARARLNVLTDLAEEWFKNVQLWREINKTTIDPNDEYFIYETLAGTYPMPGEPDDNYGQRTMQYLEKTLREGKLHSDWAEPNVDYEAVVKLFTKSLLDKKGAFWKSFKPFHEKIAGLGVINSLVQLLLKLTAPGTPDIYQGCELWDLSLVDPDNRRPVDYELRDLYLDDQNDFSALWKSKSDGRIKIRLLQTVLQIRKDQPLIFSHGEYIPLQVKGQYERHVIAFARRYRRICYVVVAPLGIATLRENDLFDWADTRVILPKNISDIYEHVFLRTTEKTTGEILLSSLFSELPLALLKFEPAATNRASGVLAHVTSLPSALGTGDFGPGARKFADQLHGSGQKYWQILPINPVNAQSQLSPYSSWSAMGGNTRLISPELLQEEGLLIDIRSTAKNELLDRAWENYKNGCCPWLADPFNDFCLREGYWLDDFSLYVVLKLQYADDPWHAWPSAFKFRDAAILTKFSAEHQQAIEKVEWLQFIFDRQWRQLKAYCNKLDIRIFGDLPFYLGYDSVDVWVNPELFSLKEDGQIDQMAGVPPDYFNADGQLWGMPVYNWGEMKAQNYHWWVQRIRKNLQLFDLLRLDHFRAFCSFWAVPADADNAIHGKWIDGPGADLFKVLQEQIGKLPFVAEDLGNIDEGVYQLRDQFKLPGMKVLQFAFGKDMPVSPHVPHNYTSNSVAYTGTHDNNTIKGWFEKEADQIQRDHLNSYTSLKINSANVNNALIRMVFASPSQLAIIPLQDLLTLDERARMNAPAATEGNWLWQATKRQLKRFPVQELKALAIGYNRL